VWPETLHGIVRSIRACPIPRLAPVTIESLPSSLPIVDGLLPAIMARRASTQKRAIGCVACTDSVRCRRTPLHGLLFPGGVAIAGRFTRRKGSRLRARLASQPRSSVGRAVKRGFVMESAVRMAHSFFIGSTPTGPLTLITTL